MKKLGKRIIYEDSRLECHIVPKKLKNYYDKGIKPTTDKQFTRLQYLNILEVLVNMRFIIDRRINFNNRYVDSFKGTGYLGNIKIAFFGDLYGPTKFAIPYKEFRKLKLDESDILAINESLIKLFENKFFGVITNR